jgi:starvation-inducible DNA-binding protein
MNPTDNSRAAVADLLNGLLANSFALYFKTKNFHWHVTGPRFRDLHLLFDEQATEIFAVTDLIAERARKLGSATLTSIGSVAARQTIRDSDDAALEAGAMVRELADDNQRLTEQLRALKEAADAASDFATSALADGWIDEAERRIWFLTATLQ